MGFFCFIPNFRNYLQGKLFHHTKIADVKQTFFGFFIQPTSTVTTIVKKQFLNLNFFSLKQCHFFVQLLTISTEFIKSKLKIAHL
jgi:hypothetical protein